MDQPEHNWIVTVAISVVGVVGATLGTFLAWLLKVVWSDRMNVEERIDDVERSLLNHEGRINVLEATHKRWDNGHTLDSAIKIVAARVEGHDRRLDSHGKRLEKIETKLEAT